MPWVAWGTNQSLYIFQTNGYSARRVRGKSEANSRGAREKRERRDKHKKSSMNNITLVSFFFRVLPSCVTDSLRFAHVRLVLSSAS